MSSNMSDTAAPGQNVPIHDDEMPGPLLRRQFELASVEKAEMGGGDQANDWYRYVLASGPAQITGYRRGTPEEVADYALSCAESFNLRNTAGKSARASTGNKRS